MNFNAIISVQLLKKPQQNSNVSNVHLCLSTLGRRGLLKPAVKGREAGYTLDRSPAYRRANTQRRKPTHSKGRTCKFCTEKLRPRFKPRTIFLYCNSANQHTTNKRIDSPKGLISLNDIFTHNALLAVVCVVWYCVYCQLFLCKPSKITDICTLSSVFITPGNIARTDGLCFVRWKSFIALVSPLLLHLFPWLWPMNYKIVRDAASCIC